MMGVLALLGMALAGFPHPVPDLVTLHPEGDWTSPSEMTVAGGGFGAISKSPGVDDPTEQLRGTLGTSTAPPSVVAQALHATWEALGFGTTTRRSHAIFVVSATTPTGRLTAYVERNWRDEDSTEIYLVSADLAPSRGAPDRTELQAYARRAFPGMRGCVTVSPPTALTQTPFGVALEFEQGLITEVRLPGLEPADADPVRACMHKALLPHRFGGFTGTVSWPR